MSVPTPDLQRDLKRMAEHTMRIRNQRIVEFTCRNLLSAHQIPHAEGLDFDGRTVVLAGAGNSLDHNGHLLRDLPPHVPLVTVNSALGALDHHGVTADLTVTIESLPLVNQLQVDNYKHLAVELSTHPGAFDYAAQHPGGMWFTGISPHNHPTLKAMGAPSIIYGGSALTAALGLIIRGGARRVVLVGMDMSPDLDTGRQYAQGAPWDGYTVRYEDGFLLYEGAEERDRLHRDNNVPTVPRKRTAYALPAWGGKGEVWTTLDLVAQHYWIEGALTHIQAINVSGRGCRFEGSAEADLKDMSFGKGEPWAPKPRKLDTTEGLAELRAQCDRAEAFADAVIAGEEPSLEDLAKGWPTVDSLTSAARSDIQQAELIPLASTVAHYEALRAAAKRIREIVC